MVSSRGEKQNVCCAVYTVAGAMSRSKSTVREPLFLSVSKKTPVTVHIRPATTRSTKQGEKVGTSSSKSRGDVRPALSASRPSQRRGAGQQVGSTHRSSRSLSSRTKSSAQSLQPKLSWEGSTHRLEIHPPRHSRRTESAGGEREDEGKRTVLRMSDLAEGEEEDGGTEGEEDGCTADEHADFESRIQSLQSEVDTLTARLEEEQQQGIPLTQSSLRRHDIREPPPPPSPEMRVLGQVASLMSSQLQRQQQEEERAVRGRREELARRLEEVEREGCTIRDQVDQLHTSLKKLGKRQSTCAVMSHLGGQRSKLMQSMSEFKRSSRRLRKLLREQQDREPCSDHTTQSTTATTALDPHLALHAQGLHDELGRKEVELQSLMMHTQSLEEQLEKRDQDHAELQTDLYEYKRKAGQEKEALKRAAKQHKKRAAQNEQAAEALEEQLAEARAELDQLASERTRQETELSSLSMRVRDLDNCLTQSKATAESAVVAVSARLSEKTKELNLLQLENNRLKTTLETIEGALKVIETNSSTKISSLEVELGQTRVTSSQYEALSEEYKSQLERCCQDCEEAQTEARRRERELERLQQDTSAEMGKCRMKFEQQLAELEPFPQLLKMSELRVQEAQQRVSVCEQRAAEQSRLVEELSTKCERLIGSLEEMRHKSLETEAENSSLLAKLETAHRRVEESDSQNRALVTTARQREESLHRIQSQLEESQATVASLHAQLNSVASESRRQQDRIRDKAAGKERAHVARIADLETQLSKSNSLNNQLHKSKEEAERLHHSRLRSLQEQLDTANASRRSMETYINFLKASYSSLCSEAGSHTAPPFHMLS